jgi:hypothetical protein
MVFGIIASIGSAVASAVSSLGPAVATFCTNVVPRIVPLLGQVGQILKTVANVVFTVLEIFEPGDDVEDIGDRAMQAAGQGIKPEKFDSFDEYMAEIRNFQLDPDKSAAATSAEKMMAGLAVGTAGMEKKFDAPEGSLGPIWLMAASNPGYFTADRLISILQTGSYVVNILRYFEGKLGPADAVEARDTMMDLDRKRSPDKTDATLYEEIDAARQTVAKADTQS